MIDRFTSSDPIDSALKDGRTALTEAEAKALLSTVGIETLAHELVENANDAVSAAERVGDPVVVKVSSSAVQHKNEWADGAGVAVGLDSADGVERASERIFEAATSEEIDADVLVERAAAVDRGTEVIVGGLRDSSFGPVVLPGLGGVFTEVYKDTSHRLAPLSGAEARGAIEELRAATLLAGYRGQPAADIDSLATVVRKVGNLLIKRTEIAEVDLNPVLATPERAVALDALVVLDRPGRENETERGGTGRL